MNAIYWHLLWVAGLLAVLGLTGGCAKEGARPAAAIELTPQTELGPTIGSLAAVVKPGPVTVEGYGLVGGLAGTGSAYCPPQLRGHFRQYILAQLPHERVSVDELLNSKNTAVVRLDGQVPAMPSEGDLFDVQVSLVPGSETSSIRAGWLYKADLVARGTFGVDTRPLAAVEGPVFVNPIGTVDSSPRSGYILGGGRTLYEYAVLLRLRRPDFRTASRIRNRISERFGPNIAHAVSASDIEVRIPPEYRWRKARFVAMIPTTFLDVTDELTANRVNSLVHQLAVAEDKESSEVALEALGSESRGKLNVLLNSADAEVRFRAARCMLALHDDRGLGPLRELATSKDSPHRLEALDAIMVSAKRNAAAALAQRLLRDDDVRIVLAAYEHLRRIDDPTVRCELIGRSFLLEQVAQTNHQAIFVSRSGEPRVVLFGAPLACRDNMFVESPSGTTIVDSRAGQDHVSIIRKHPTRPGVIGPVLTSSRLSDLIRTLGSEPAPGGQGQLSALAVPYVEVVALLEQMIAKEAVAAEFWPGPLPKMDPVVKK